MSEWRAEDGPFRSGLGRPAMAPQRAGFAQREQPKRAAAKDWRARMRALRAAIVSAASGGAIPAAVAREALAAGSIKEAVAGGTLLGLWGQNFDDDFRGYRTDVSYGRQPLRRELDSWSYQELVSRSLFAYAANPIAGWLVDTTVRLCVGDELNYSIEIVPERLPETQRSDESVKRLQADIRTHLDRFWKHRAHNIQMRAHEYATTFLVTGNLLLPVKFLDANPESGLSVLGVPTLDLIDAQQITGVRSAESSAIVAGEVLYQVIAYGGTSAAGGETKALKVIRENASGELEGDALFFKHASLLNSLIGYPWLMSVLDWLDRSDDYAFKSLDRAGILNSVVWHVTMEGLTPEQCQKETDRLVKEGFGRSQHAVIVTNAKGGVEAAVPKIDAAENDAFNRWLRIHVLGRYGYPESWYSAGSDTNRATAADQTDVTYKSLESVQGRLRPLFDVPLWYAYDAGRAAQQSGSRRDWPARSTGAVVIRATMPPIRERDYQRSGAALGAIVGAVAEAEAEGYISHSTAQKMVWLAASKLGTDIREDEERAEIQRDGESDAATANERAADALRRAEEKPAGTFSVGDSVRVKPGEEHAPEHAGALFTVSAVRDGAYELKNSAGEKHRWYTASELIDGDEKEEPEEHAA